MKFLFSICALLCASLMLAQDGDNESYVMFQTVYIAPDTETASELQEAMAHHNKTYHESGTPYQSNVWNVATGPRGGHMVWTMGPVTFSQLDDRPSGEHDTDWATNVVPKIEDAGPVEYWRLDDTWHVNADVNNSMLYIRFFKVAKGQGYRIDGLMDKIHAAVKSMDSEDSWAVYDNMFRQGSMGRHIAVVSGMNSWADLDEDWNFRAAYEEVHGANSWDGFIRESNEIWEDSYDEIWVLSPEMSSGGN